MHMTVSRAPRWSHEHDGTIAYTAVYLHRGWPILHPAGLYLLANYACPSERMYLGVLRRASEIKG